MFLKPFQAVRYSLNKVNIEDVVCPPYDVISPEQQEQLYSRSQYNVVRLVLGKQYVDDKPENNRYTRAANFFQDWQKQGVLIQDQEPSLYLYQQQYTLNNEVKTINGLIGLVKLEPLGQTIHPHEKTLSAPKIDRLELMRACKTNFCPIYAVYDDKPGHVAAVLRALSSTGAPLFTINDGKVRHSLWAISHQPSINKLTHLLKEKELLIADGHHRYETALNYQKEMQSQGAAHGEQAYDYVMMFLVDMANEDLTVLPTHRLIKTAIPVQKLIELIKANFQITEVNTVEKLLKIQTEAESVVFGLAAKDKYFILKGSRAILSQRINLSYSLAWKSLDTAILNELILKPLSLEPNKTLFFSEDTNLVLNQVQAGKTAYAFILQPTSLEQIMQVSQLGEKMPQKSTYFYPKPLTGLAIYKF